VAQAVRRVPGERRAAPQIIPESPADLDQQESVFLVMGPRLTVSPVEASEDTPSVRAAFETATADKIRDGCEPPDRQSARSCRTPSILLRADEVIE
jgi:hypothetical protein